jgi:type I restriction enzyme S subunit
MRVAMPKVNREALADCLLWYPSHNEQRAILEFVSRESSPYDVAVARAQREIALMQEYRTRLTADVVTGKLDVRAAASRLPDSSFGGERPTDGERFDELESMDENTPEDP